MNEKEYFSHLYEIASHLNQEFALQAALRKALEKTVSLLNLETGWIWLVQSDNKSVYLAASYNLPPALSNYPERLSGWCYCIEKYLTNRFSEAKNISEITCSRLKDIHAETRDLKFHATVPIFVKGEKAGILNLLSKESQQLDDKELSMLNTIAELIGIAIQRTRLQEYYETQHITQQDAPHKLLSRILQPRLEALLASLDKLTDLAQQQPAALEQVFQAIALAKEMEKQMDVMGNDFAEKSSKKTAQAELHYPASPLTNRELEVLGLVKKGLTNKQIAEQLFITERTVKFHLSAILSKLYAKTRTEAVDTALRRGLLGV